MFSTVTHACYHNSNNLFAKIQHLTNTVAITHKSVNNNIHNMTQHIFLPSLQEFELLQSWGLTETDLAQATFSAARASFCSDQDRKEMMKELRKVFGIEDKVELEIFINHKCGQPDDPRKVLKTSF